MLCGWYGATDDDHGVSMCNNEKWRATNERIPLKNNDSKAKKEKGKLEKKNYIEHVCSDATASDRYIAIEAQRRMNEMKLNDIGDDYHDENRFTTTTTTAI